MIPRVAISLLGHSVSSVTFNYKKTLLNIVPSNVTTNGTLLTHLAVFIFVHRTLVSFFPSK